MKNRFRLPVRILSALAVCGALAFGSAQAFAAPGSAEAAPRCDPEKCAASCGGFGICRDRHTCLC